MKQKNPAHIAGFFDISETDVLKDLDRFAERYKTISLQDRYAERLIMFKVKLLVLGS